MTMFFISIAFITLSFFVGYVAGLSAGRKLAILAVEYTMKVIVPFLPKEFNFNQALDAQEEKLKKQGVLPSNYKYKGK